jgi:hypothetical protein
MPKVVECPAADCDGSFDAVEASTAGQPSECCPHCGATWVELHRAVDPDIEGEDPGFEIGFDGEIRRESDDEAMEVAR